MLLTSLATESRVTLLAAALAPAATDAGGRSIGGMLAILGLFAVGCALIACWARFVRPLHVALGFATTAALWAFGYVAMMRPGLIGGEVLFAAMLAALFMGGFVAGRFASGSDGVRPVSVGLVSATVNLLVLGAFLRDERHGSQLTPVLYVVGLFAVSAALSWLGGIVGRLAPSRRRLPDAQSLFAFVAAATVFLLLITGGLVTALESGLAVPDWPNSFGHNMLLYPISEMKGGIYWEHAHRLYGMLVGTTAVALAATVWRLDSRGWVRALVTAAFVMVCVQGLLGGLRVTGRLTLSQDPQLLSPQTALAITHGVFGQVVFATFLVIAAASSRRWREADPPMPVPHAILDRDLTVVVPFVLLGQLVLGALYRHLQPGGGATAANHPTWAINSHIVLAVVVTFVLGTAAARAWGSGCAPVVRRIGTALLALLLLQIVLGVVAVAAVWSRAGTEIPVFEAVVTTMHQATGALLLGGSVLLAAWTRRLVAPEVRGVAPAASAS